MYLPSALKTPTTKITINTIHLIFNTLIADYT